MIRSILATAALALALVAHPAGADGHVREYVVPFVPGAARAAYRNTLIVVSNMQRQPAIINLRAHVNRSELSVSCGALADLAPYEIRLLSRNAGTLCLADDEPADASLRIRTADGVHVAGYMVLSASRGNGFVPVDVISVEPAGPEGISFSTLTLRGVTIGTSSRGYRVSIALRSSSRSWPHRLIACIHTRHLNFEYSGLVDDPTRNCSLPNEQLRGWTTVSDYRSERSHLLPIETPEGSATSVVAQRDYYDSGNERIPPTYRVCISRAPDDGLLPRPFLCKEVTAGSAAAQEGPQDEAALSGD